MVVDFEILTNFSCLCSNCCSDHFELASKLVAQLLCDSRSIDLL